jgi:DNA-directed RNA polymerase specialized sigma24 family protein
VFARLRVCTLTQSTITREAALINTAIKQCSTRPVISRRDLEVMMATAAAHARKLARSLRLSQTEREDAEQDILLMLLERWHYFDNSRGSNIGFAIRIARQAAQVIADRIAAGWQTDLVSLEDPAPWQDWGTDDAVTVSEQVGDESLPGEAALVSALSFRGFTATLPRDLLVVVEAVFAADGDMPEAQKISTLSSSEFHRRLRELRYRLVCLELVPRSWLTHL